MAQHSSFNSDNAPGSHNSERTGSMSIHHDMNSGESTVSGPPPSYTASVTYHLCPEGFSGNEYNTTIDSHRTTSHIPDTQNLTSASEPSNNNIGRPSTGYRPSSFSFDPSKNSSSSPSHSPMPNSNTSDVGISRSMSQAPSTILAAASPRTVGNTNPTVDDKITEMAKNLISKNPELRNNIYSLLGSTMAAARTIQPQDLKDRDAKIEALEKQLLEARTLGREQTARIGGLEADLKLAVDTGLEQADSLEDLQHRLTRAETAENNLRKGVLAINSKYVPLQTEHANLKKKFKAAEQEIARLEAEVDFQDKALGAYYNQVKDYGVQNVRMQADMRGLQRVNHELKVKGEQMSGRLVAVAEQWHEPGMGMATADLGTGPHGASAGSGADLGGAGGRKRQASDLLEDGERMRKFSRMAR